MWGIKKIDLASEQGMSLIEILITLGLVGIVMFMSSQLFQRTYHTMRVIDAKEKVRQAGRLGLNRISSELREATKLVSVGPSSLSFEKINPSAVAVPPTPEPMPVGDVFVPPVYDAAVAYPDQTRLLITYQLDGELLKRTVAEKQSGESNSQVIVSDINYFQCLENPNVKGEFTVTVTVLDGSQAKSLSSKVLCPCLKAGFGV